MKSKNTGILFFLLIIVGMAVQYLTQNWWAIVPTSAVLAFIFKTPPLKAFLLCFSALSAGWFTLAAYQHYTNHAALSNAVSAVFKLSSGTQLLYITAFIGGLTAGLGGLTGSLFYRIFQKN